MQKAQASSRTNPSEAISQNERALDRLRQAQDRLQQSSGQSGRQSGQAGASGREQQISDLRQRAAQAASRQREIAKDMENLARRGGQNGQDENSRRSRKQSAERKDTLADSVNSLQQDIEQSARSMGNGQGQQRAARQLKEASDALARDRIADRIREGKQNLNGQQAGNGNNERAIERSLNAVAERLQSAEQSARSSGGSSAEENLDRTRQLADSLESLRRRMDENASQRNGQQGNQQNGQQQSERGEQQRGREGQQQGQQQGGQQSGGTQNAGQQRGQQRDSQERTGPNPLGQIGGDDWGDNRQLPAEIRERVREAQDLRQQWSGTTTGGSRELDQIIDRLKKLADGHMDGSAATAALLKADVIEPLRQLELELSRQIQQQSGRTNLRLRDEGAAPEKYRKAVEEYYRRLSKVRQ